MMAQMAAATGRDKEAQSYREQLAKITQAFNNQYVKQDGSITVDTQTAYALALFADLVPRGKRRATGRKLAEMIQQNGTRMSTGFLGTRPLLPVLTSVGQHDLAMFLFQSREFPSWGYEVEQGATTIWERWDSYTKEDGFGRHNAAMNSFSHYSFGAVCEWMFNTLAGIRAHEPGYQKIIIRPRPALPGSNAEREVINWVKASHESVRGRIVSNWRVKDGRFELDVEIPANTTATVIIPATPESQITESGKDLKHAPGVRGVRIHRNNVAIIAIASGKYRFSSTKAIERATQSFKTSPPPDNSTNPEAIDLDGATVVASWDFAKDSDVAQWSKCSNLKTERREAGLFLVATGDDPQIETQLKQPATGPLVLMLKARPATGADVEFFWAGAGGWLPGRPIDKACTQACRASAGVPVSHRQRHAD